MAGPKQIEKLTQYEKAHLSRDMILKWHKAKRKEKLKAIQAELRETFRKGEMTKLERLKTVIIENTKHELKKLKLSQKELIRRAKAFGESIIRVAKGQATLEGVIRGVVSKGAEKGIGDEVLKTWLDTKGEVVEDDIKYLALRQLNYKRDAKEAFVLLGLIEEFWGRKEAIKQFNKFNPPTSKTYNMEKLRAFFTRGSTLGRLGFWYGTRKIKWDPEATVKTWTAEHFESTIEYDKSEEVKTWVQTFKYFNVWVTGWWAHDTDDSNENNFVDDKGQHFEKDVLGKILKGGGYGDEWLGRNILEATNRIRYELKAKPVNEVDSGLGSSTNEKKVIDFFNDLITKLDISYGTAREKLYEWFSKNAENEWVSLPKEKAGLMNYLYGKGWGKNLFRYVPEQKKVYWLIMKNAENPHNHYESGYIKVKNKRLESWQAFSRRTYKKDLKEKLIEKMPKKQLKKEAMGYKIKHEKVLTKEIALLATKGICVKLSKFSSNKEVVYEDLGEYLRNFEDALARYIAKTKKDISKERARELAIYRREYIEEEINKKIKDDNLLLELLDEDPEEKIVININSKDKVRVKAKNRKKYRNFLKEKQQELEGVVTKAKDLVSGAYAKLEDRVGPIFAWILDKILGIKKGLKKIYEGGSSFFTKILYGVLGLGGTLAAKATIGARKVTQEVMDAMGKYGKKVKRLARKMYFDMKVKLNGKKIVIPRGLGIKPGKSFQVEIKGKGKTTISPVKEEKKVEKKGKEGKFNILGLLFKRKKKTEEFVMKDKRIVIPEGTEIPKGTIIPRGAKVIRTKKS